MTAQQFAAFLDQTLQDSRLSRGERQALAAVEADEPRRAEFRRLAFEKAGAAIDTPTGRAVLEWLEGVLKALQPRSEADTPTSEAYFSPGEDCCGRLIRFIGSARKSLDVCVFTITDDRITRALIEAHRRRVVLRVLTDDDKSHDLGSDIEELHREGIAVRMDSSPNHMHHKFALADGGLLLTGSFNWTRSAGANNQENFIITYDARLAAAFAKEFARLWKTFGGS